MSTVAGCGEVSQELTVMDTSRFMGIANWLTEWLTR